MDHFPNNCDRETKEQFLQRQSPQSPNQKTVNFLQHCTRWIPSPGWDCQCWIALQRLEVSKGQSLSQLWHTSSWVIHHNNAQVVFPFFFGSISVASHLSHSPGLAVGDGVLILGNEIQVKRLAFSHSFARHIYRTGLLRDCWMCTQWLLRRANLNYMLLLKKDAAY